MRAQVSVRLSEEDLVAVDALVAAGRFLEWIGDLGIAALAAFHEAEQGTPL